MDSIFGHYLCFNMILISVTWQKYTCLYSYSITLPHFGPLIKTHFRLLPKTLTTLPHFWPIKTHMGPLVFKLKYRWFPSYLLCTLLLFPFHLLLFPVHPTGYSSCFFPGFLIMFAMLSSKNNKNKIVLQTAAKKFTTLPHFCLNIIQAIKYLIIYCLRISKFSSFYVGNINTRINWTSVENTFFRIESSFST